MSQKALNRVKGALFESQVAYLLEKSGYRPISPDGISVKEGSLRGRGGWHQIDAFGYYSFGVPCLYPIRVICEAKNYAGKAGLPVVRNFVGAFKDIAENYFIEKRGASTDHLLARRYTDAGAIFSAHGFTVQAQDYAYAQCVFLISYEDNVVLSPLLEASGSLLGSINLTNAAENTYSFKNWINQKVKNPQQTLEDDATFSAERFATAFSQYVDTIRRIRTSYLGTASGVYPIHLLSESQIPWNLFETTDEVTCRIYYHRESANCLEIVPEGSTTTRFYASIPREIMANHKDRIRMLDFKGNYFSYVDFPVLQNEKRRILKFRLDTQWIDSLRKRYELEHTSYRF